MLGVYLLSLSILFMGVWSIRIGHTPIDNLRDELLQLESKLLKELSSPRLAQANLEEKFAHVIKTYKAFGSHIDEQFPNNYDQTLDVLNSLWLWARTQKDKEGIDGLYMVFRHMQRETIDQNAPVNVKRLADFARTILSDPNASIPFAMGRIADYITEQKLFISAYKEVSARICTEQQSPQQLLYNLYKSIALTEIKGYTMIQFSYVLLGMYNTSGESFNEEMLNLKQEYAFRASETVKAVQVAMAFAPQDFWRCDPSKHGRDETFTELNQLFQGYIVNEVDLNSESTCKENCAYYQYAKVHGCYDGSSICSQQRRCNGKVLNCEYVDSDMWVCPSARDSNRRYEYIEYENGRMYGNKKSCNKSTMKIDSWWRWLFWHCSYCFCYCDDQNSHSHRYFNLRDVTSDIKNNKVVTGVKFKKVKQIIHIQIQESQLMPSGNINESSISWKPTEDYSVLDSNVRAGKDFHALSWEKRAIDIDDLKSDPGYLLTGLRFRMVGSHLNLEIRVTPFNFTTGELFIEKSYWHSNDFTDRSELKLPKPDIPIHTNLNSIPDSNSNQYLNFAASDREKDAAQSTIPFIDIQPVVTDPPTLMSGAGVYHKGHEGSGGFVGLKLFTYNYGPHLHADVPPPPPIIERHNEITAV